MCSVDRACALPDPQEVARGVERDTGARVNPRHGALIVEKERLMAHEELNRRQRVDVGPARVHKPDRTVNLVRRLLIA